MSEQFFREEFPSSFESMVGTLDRAVDTLVARELICGSDVPSTRLCLEEALVNAIRHGNCLDPHKKVRLEMAAEEEGCTLCVYDEGCGFSAEKIHLPPCDQMGGRGICLIRHYMDEVRYLPDRRCLEMRFNRKACCKGE